MGLHCRRVLIIDTFFLYITIQITFFFEKNSFLTGKYTKESVPDPKHFLELRNNSIVNIAKFDKNWEILDEVTAISKEINKTPVQVIKINKNNMVIYLYIN
jgi:hypothetical protein